MAKYRLIRNENGTYNIQAQLSQGRVLLYTKGAKNVKSEDLQVALESLGQAVQIERAKRGMTRSTPGIPGLEE